MEKSRKKKLIISLVSLTAIAGTSTALIFYYLRQEIKNLSINNIKEGGVNKLIPFEASEFKNEWEKDKYSLESSFLKTYFEVKLPNKKANEILAKIKCEVALSDDQKELKVKVTHNKTFGKTETKTFILKGFKEISPEKQKAIQDLNDFATKFQADIDVLDKNKLASSIINSDLSPINIANKDNYDWTFEFNPNDKKGELIVVASIVSKEYNDVKKTISKTFSDFIKNEIASAAKLNYKAKNQVNDLLNIKTILDSAKDLQGQELINKLKEYGTFDESNLLDCSYKILGLVSNNDGKNDEPITIKYKLTKKVIVGKINNQYKYEEIASDEKEISVSFTEAITKNYEKVIDEILEAIQKAVTNKEIYRIDKLASSFSTSDWDISWTSAKFPDVINDFNENITVKATSDYDRKVIFEYTIATKTLSNNVTKTKLYELDGFEEDLPSKRWVTLKTKNDNHFSGNTFSKYVDNNTKTMDIVDDITYDGGGDGWNIQKNTLVVKSHSGYYVTFKVKFKKEYTDLEGNHQTVEKDIDIVASYEQILKTNATNELNIFANDYKNALSIPDKNKLASQIIESDFAPINIPNLDKYEITYEFIPNDKTGTLEVIVKFVDKSLPAITSEVQMNFNGFLIDEIKPTTSLTYSAKTAINDLTDVDTIIKNTKDLSDKALINELEEYGTFNKSNLFGSDFKILAVERIGNDKNDNPLKIKYKFVKKVIIGKANGEYIYEEIASSEKEINVSFTEAITKNYQTLLQDILDFVEKKVKSQDAYEHNKLASKFDESNDWDKETIYDYPFIDAEEFVESFTGVKKSDWDKAVKLDYHLTTKCLTANVSAQRTFKLEGFAKDDPVLKDSVSITKKDDNNISYSKFSQYVDNNVKAMEIVSDPTYTNSPNDGWSLVPNSLVIKELKDTNDIYFEAQIAKNYIDLYNTNHSKTETISFHVSYKEILEKNATAEINTFATAFENNIDVANKADKLPSTITETDLVSITIPEFNNYLYEYAFTPNDTNGTLEVKVIIKDKGNQNITKTITKSLSGFKTN